MLWQLASTTTSKLPPRMAWNHGPVGTTFCSTLRPIFFHSPISQVPTNL